MSDSSSTRLVFFAHNRRDTAFVRRVAAFRRAGLQVTTYTFRRDGEPAQPGPDWPNVDLGHLEHARFLRRAGVYLGTLATIVRKREDIAHADIVYARNLDIFLLAWLARRLASWRPQSVLVYECLDVHEALIGSSWRARVLRAVERWCLRAARLLVISSPGFLREHFEPLQGYRGPTHWIENKLFLGDTELPRPLAPAARSDGRITVGWVGIIRCTRTLDLLIDVARALPERVQVRISGLVSYFLIPDFDQRIADHANITFTGPYSWPEGLADVYAQLDVVWSQELSWRDGNSDWLIPNRIYEASYFGVPSLAVAGTQTAMTIAERNLGYVLADDSSDQAIGFLASLDHGALDAHRRQLLDAPADGFVLGERDTQALIEAMRQAAT